MYTSREFHVKAKRISDWLSTTRVISLNSRKGRWNQVPRYMFSFVSFLAFSSLSCHYSTFLLTLFLLCLVITNSSSTLVSALTSTLSGCLTRKERFSLISADWTDFIQSLKFSVSRSSHSRLRWFVCFFFANLDSRYTSLFSAFDSPPVYPFWRTWTIIINFVIIT